MNFQSKLRHILNLTSMFLYKQTTIFKQINICKIYNKYWIQMVTKIVLEACLKILKLFKKVI